MTRIPKCEAASNSPSYHTYPSLEKAALTSIQPPETVPLLLRLGRLLFRRVEDSYRILQ